MYKPNYLASATAGFSCAETKATNRAAKTMLRNILLKLYFKLYKQSDIFNVTSSLHRLQRSLLALTKKRLSFSKLFFANCDCVVPFTSRLLLYSRFQRTSTDLIFFFSLCCPIQCYVLRIFQHPFNLML